MGVWTIDTGQSLEHRRNVTVTIPDRAEASIQRLLSTGRFVTIPDVIEAGLRALENETEPPVIEAFPPGSLAHLFTAEQNAEEVALVKGSSLKIEDE